MFIIKKGKTSKLQFTECMTFIYFWDLVDSYFPSTATGTRPSCTSIMAVWVETPRTPPNQDWGRVQLGSSGNTCGAPAVWEVYLTISKHDRENLCSSWISEKNIAKAIAWYKEVNLSSEINVFRKNVCWERWAKKTLLGSRSINDDRIHRLFLIMPNKMIKYYSKNKTKNTHVRCSNGHAHRVLRNK